MNLVQKALTDNLFTLPSYAGYATRLSLFSFLRIISSIRNTIWARTRWQASFVAMLQSNERHEPVINLQMRIEQNVG
jgi:hypothetical protein